LPRLLTIHALNLLISISIVAAFHAIYLVLGEGFERLFYSHSPAGVPLPFSVFGLQAEELWKLVVVFFFFIYGSLYVYSFAEDMGGGKSQVGFRRVLEVQSILLTVSYKVGLLGIMLAAVEGAIIFLQLETGFLIEIFSTLVSILIYVLIFFAAMCVSLFVSVLLYVFVWALIWPVIWEDERDGCAPGVISASSKLALQTATLPITGLLS